MIESYFIECSRLRNVQTITNGRVSDSKEPTIINGYLGSRSQVYNQIAGKYVIDSEFKFYCDDLDLKFGDYIYYESKYYEVISEPKNTAHKNHHIKCMVKHINSIT